MYGNRTYGRLLLSVFGGRVRLHGFQCSAQLLNCNVEGFVLGKQELFFQQDDYATCIDRIRTF